MSVGGLLGEREKEKHVLSVELQKATMTCTNTGQLISITEEELLPVEAFLACWLPVTTNTQQSDRTKSNQMKSD